MQRGELKGILWHQGESDNTVEKASEYLEKLKTLVQNLRRDLKAPNLPFIAGEIGYFNKEDHINEVLNQAKEEIPFFEVVSAKDLTDRDDQLHFDTPSARELGERFARKMIKIQDLKEKRPTVILTFDDAEISHYTKVAPMLLEFGYPATFFVCEFPLNKPEEKEQYMSWQQILAYIKWALKLGIILATIGM